MKWYVRDTDEGHVFGPMSREEAEDAANRLDNGIMFDENIFEPRFVMSSEVADVVKRLRSCYDRENPPANPLLLEAAEALTLLSREKLIEARIEGGVFELDSEMPAGVRLVVRDYDVQGDEDVTTDSEGRECVESEYGGE